MDFTRGAWPNLEPGTPYVHGYHIEAIADHLEAMTQGEILRLAINIPPRHGKSLLVAVCWPAWVWQMRPWFKWMFASYSLDLAKRDGLKTYELIQSPWYQERWGDRFRITKATEDLYRTSERGHRVLASPDARGLGEGGDCVAADDPHNTRETESEAVRGGTLRWWAESMGTRLNDLKTGLRLIIMQRLHENDLSGYVLKEMGYEHLCLPLEFEPSRLVPLRADKTPNPFYIPPTSIGFTDWRSREGELLWPEKNGPAEVETLKRDLGHSAFAIAGQLQQRPAPRGGGMFKRENFKIIDALPEGTKLVRRVRRWDFASTDPKKQLSTTDPDWTRGGLFAMDQEARFYVLHMTGIRADPGDVEKLVRAMAEVDGRGVPIHIAQDPGQAGKFQVNYYRRMLAGYSVNPPMRQGGKGKKRDINIESGSKSVRAEPLASYSEAGMVYVLRGDWNNAYIDEMCGFPTAAHDDQVDVSSGAFLILTQDPPGLTETMKHAGYFDRHSR